MPSGVNPLPHTALPASSAAKGIWLIWLMLPRSESEPPKSWRAARFSSATRNHAD